ncbi:MAG: glycosyltransferase [Elusimicrobia bacterium]|nr:glycosyltransferase [Elusimicrobiota bacterium]
MTRLRVLQVLECGGPGGTGNQVAALCRYLDSMGVDVDLVFAVRSGAEAAEYRSRIPGGVRAHHVPEMVREISPLRDIKALFKLYRIFKNRRPDVVHAHSSKAGFLARVAAKLAGVPAIFYTPHGYSFLQLDRSALSRCFYRLLERSVSWIGEIIAVSDSEREFARLLSWGKTVHLVPDVYLGRMPPPPLREHHGLVIGTCGRITSARSPNAFLELCRRLTAARPDLRCLWIGGGEDESFLRDEIERLGLSARIEITGWLAPEEARDRLRDLDILVHYSRWDALPNAVIEAMALGLPAVVSDIPGCRDCVVDGVNGFRARNLDELAARCLELSVDAPKRKALGAKGQEMVRARFGNGNHERLLSLYDPARTNVQPWFHPERLKPQETADIDKVEAGLDVSRSDFGAYYRLLKHGRADWVRDHALMDQGQARNYAVQVHALLRRFPLPQAPVILDAGCGPGAITEALRLELGAAETFGIDLSQSAVEYARKRYPGCRFDCLPIDERGSLPQNYDIIHAREFYPFTRTKDGETHRRYLRLFARHLRPGGVIVLSLLATRDSLAATAPTLGRDFPFLESSLASDKLPHSLPLTLANALTAAARLISGKPGRRVYLFGPWPK